MKKIPQLLYDNYTYSPGDQFTNGIKLNNADKNLNILVQFMTGITLFSKFGVSVNVVNLDDIIYDTITKTCKFNINKLQIGTPFYGILLHLILEFYSGISANKIRIMWEKLPDTNIKQILIPAINVHNLSQDTKEWNEIMYNIAQYIENYDTVLAICKDLQPLPLETVLKKQFTINQLLQASPLIYDMLKSEPVKQSYWKHAVHTYRNIIEREPDTTVTFSIYKPINKFVVVDDDVLDKAKIKNYVKLFPGKFKYESGEWYPIFANKKVGGGWLTHGFVQEEKIMFEFPETGMALFLNGRTTLLSPMEIASYENVKHVIDIEPYGNKVYSVKVEKSKSWNPVNNGPRVNFVVLDAINISKTGKMSHSDVYYMMRKLLASMTLVKSKNKVFNFGNWGCGAFGHDIKFILRLVSLCANLVEIPVHYYLYTNDDDTNVKYYYQYLDNSPTEILEMFDKLLLPERPSFKTLLTKPILTNVEDLVIRALTDPKFEKPTNKEAELIGSFIENNYSINNIKNHLQGPHWKKHLISIGIAIGP